MATPRSTPASTSKHTSPLSELVSPRVKRARLMLTSTTEASINTPRKQFHGEDRKRYIDRIETYACWTWFAKPTLLSPMQCSLHGWKNTDTDIITCECCGSIMDCKIEDDLEPTPAEAVAFEMFSKLKTNHKSFCFWLNNPLAVDFMYGPLCADSKILFEERLDALTARHARAPLPTLHTPGEAVLEICERYQQRVNANVNGICTLALCGWEPTHSNDDIRVRCTCCRAKSTLSSEDVLDWPLSISQAHRQSSKSKMFSPPMTPTTTSQSVGFVTPQSPSSSSDKQTTPQQRAAAMLGSQRRFGVSPQRRSRGGSAQTTPAASPAVTHPKAGTNGTRFNPLTSHRGFCLFYEADIETLCERLRVSHAAVVDQNNDWRYKVRDAVKLLNTVSNR